VFQNGEITDFPGNYSDYRIYENSNDNTEKKVEKAKQTVTNEKPKSLSYLEQKELKNLEKDIQKLEENKESLQQSFLSDLSPDQITTNSKKLQEIENEIDQKTERWFELESKK
jgi:ATP-binding cassette subfamily F protein uup